MSSKIAAVVPGELYQVWSDLIISYPPRDATFAGSPIAHVIITRNQAGTDGGNHADSSLVLYSTGGTRLA